MNIKLKIDKSTLDVTCEDETVIVNEIFEDDSLIHLEVVKPEPLIPNVYEQLTVNRGVVV